MPDRLQVVGLTVALGDTRRARTSLTTSAGGSLALFGPSGAGKTTMLRAIAHLLPPDEGTVQLGGLEPSAIGWPVYRRRVLYVGQRPTMLDGTVLENLERAFAYRSATTPFDRDAAERRLSELRLPDDVSDRTAADLSVGEQQRVALVRALIVRPDVFLFDEPTSALDTDSEQAVESMIAADLAERGASAVIITHDVEQSRRLGAERVDLETFEVPK